MLSAGAAGALKHLAIRRYPELLKHDPVFYSDEQNGVLIAEAAGLTARMRIGQSVTRDDAIRDCMGLLEALRDKLALREKENRPRPQRTPFRPGRNRVRLATWSSL
jgi:hypothetical protein